MEINEENLSRIVLSLLESLKDPRSSVDRIGKDLESIGVEYCVIGGISLGAHNYIRATEDLDILVSKRTYDLISKELIGKGYTYRPGTKRNLFYHSATGKLEVDILIEGGTEGTFVLPNPIKIRKKMFGVWYIDLPNLIQFKLESGRPKDIQDIMQLIELNTLDASFSTHIDQKYRGKFLQIMKKVRV